MTETNDFHASQLRKLKLQPLALSELPSHPTLPGKSSSPAPDLVAFVAEVLREATLFGDSLIPQIFSRKGSPKSSPPSAAKVQLLSCDVICGEAWFGRQSHHDDDAAKPGTACWREFEDGLFHDHSVHEAEYTPNVYDAHKILDYAEQLAGKDFGGFSDVHVELYEMVHRMPAMLENRAFSTLVVRARDGPKSFVDAQIPVDVSSLPAALYCNGRNQKEGDSALKRSKVTVGEYVSVERVRLLDAGSDAGKILWEMATASDAKGSLPMALQKMGVPGAVAKDVGFFMDFVMKKRKA